MSRIVVVGSGGREHALAWAMSRHHDVVVTPGNDGIAASGIACSSASPLNLSADLFVIGPEVPLVAGLADTLRAQGKSVLGPGAAGAQLEGSKAYMKELLATANVPTADFGAFRHVDGALAMLRSMSPPYVVKTDGLAAGKGVLVTNSLSEAEADVRDKLSGAAFGDAGTTVVIEEGLEGEECTLLILCDGERATALLPSQDFKRVADGDQGPNTGGMGAFAPLPSVTPAIVDEAMHTIVQPTMRELRRRGINYRGVLYGGLMLTKTGPKLLEYNVRFGDPETQVVVPMMADDVASSLAAAAEGRMHDAPRFRGGAAVTVVLAADGYPTKPRTGDVIDGLGADGQLAVPREGVNVFHAGTRRDPDGQFRTAGGRVVALTAVGDSIGAARARVYEAASSITFPGRVMRGDIAANYDGGAP